MKYLEIYRDPDHLELAGCNCGVNYYYARLDCSRFYGLVIVRREYIPVIQLRCSMRIGICALLILINIAIIADNIVTDGFWADLPWVSDQEWHLE